MAASIEDVRQALLGALGELATTAGGPAEYVGMYNGEVTQRTGVNTETLGASTALLLGLAGEAPDARRDVQTIHKARSRVAGRSQWSVYVIVQRLDGAEGEMAGDAHAAGMTALTDAVHGALTGLRIDGLLPGEAVEFLGSTPHLLDPGRVLVYLMRFSVLRALPQAAPVRMTPLAPLTTVRFPLQTPEADPAARLDLTTVDADALDD